MADSIADVLVTESAWVDVYTTTGIPIGNALFMVNKGAHTVLVWIGASAPPVSSTDGYPLYPVDHGINYGTVDAGESGVWVKALEDSCKLHVQQV